MLVMLCFEVVGMNKQSFHYRPLCVRTAWRIFAYYFGLSANWSAISSASDSQVSTHDIIYTYLA